MKRQGFENLTQEEIALRNKKAAEANRARIEANKLKKYKTLSAAVKAHCKGCIYGPLAGGTWLQQIGNCTLVKCELYEWRPMPKVQA